MLSHDEIRLALSQAPCFVSAMTRDGRVVYSSCYAYGYEEADLRLEPSDKLIHPEDRPAWWAALFRARDRREVVPYSVRVVTPEPPGIVRLAGRLYPVIDPATLQVKFVGCVCEDVTHATAPPSGGAVETQPLPPRPLIVPPGAKWLSPLGERVLRWLQGRHPAWHTAEAIADAVGETAGHRFRAALTGLADRHLIESAAGSGYRAVMPDPNPT